MPNLQQVPTITEAIRQYLRSLTSQYSSHTSSAYAQALRLFERIIHTKHHINPHHTSVDLLTADWISTYLQHLQDTSSVETEHLYSRALLTFCQYSHQQGYLHPQQITQLIHYVTTHRRPKQHIIPQLPLDAIETILSHTSTLTLTPTQNTSSIDRNYLRILRDKAFLLTLAHTGARVSEICSLTKHTFDPLHSTITLSDECMLPIPPNVTTAIRQYLTTRQPLDRNQILFNEQHLPIFSRHDKKASKRILPISRWTAANIISYWVQEALPPDIRNQLQQHHLSISPQTFRHYFVITTLQRTGDLNETQLLARHIDPATTRRYLRYTTPKSD